MAVFLKDHDIEFIEQPVVAHDIEGLRFVRTRSPLCASDSSVPAGSLVSF